MAITYLKRIRKDLFPKVDDWTKPMDNFKDVPVGELTYSQWFWFHPSAYQLVYWGVPSCALLQGSILFVIWLYIQSTYLLVSWILFGLLGLYLLYSKYNKRKAVEGLTFYDIYLKDEVLPYG